MLDSSGSDERRGDLDQKSTGAALVVVMEEEGDQAVSNSSFSHPYIGNAQVRYVLPVGER